MRRITTIATAASAALLLTSCSAFSDDGPGHSADGKPQVVAAFYPLQFVTEAVGADLIDVTDLTKPGGEPHDLELDPTQVASVIDADLVVYEKGLQTAVDSALGQKSAGAELDAAAVAGLEPLSHDGHDDAAHDDAESDEEHDHSDLGDLDPHFWLDPLKLAKVADAVARQLSDLDPAHADTYAANAAALVKKLRAVDQEFSTVTDGCERDTIVVSHNAFGYWGRYGLYIEPISGLSPDAEPTPADLARLQQLITSDGITTVFGERLVSAKESETLAHDMGVTTAVLDPIEGLTDETSSDDYLSLMRANLAALRKANGCQ